MGFNIEPGNPRPLYNYSRSIEQITDADTPQQVSENDNEGIHRASVWIINATATDDILVSIYLVPQGGSPGSSNKVMNNVTLNGNETLVLPEKLIMEGGDTIWAEASEADSINIYVGKKVET